MLGQKKWKNLTVTQCQTCEYTWSPPQGQPHYAQVALIRYLVLLELGCTIGDARIGQLSAEDVDLVLTLLYTRVVQGEVLSLSDILVDLVRFPWTRGGCSTNRRCSMNSRRGQ